MSTAKVKAAMAAKASDSGKSRPLRPRTATSSPSPVTRAESRGRRTVSPGPIRDSVGRRNPTGALGGSASRSAAWAR